MARRRPYCEGDALVREQHAINDWHNKVDASGLDRDRLRSYSRSLDCWELCFDELCHAYEVHVRGGDVLSVSRCNGIGVHVRKDLGSQAPCELGSMVCDIELGGRIPDGEAYQAKIEHIFCENLSANLSAQMHHALEC